MSNDEEFQILNKSSKFKKQILKENYQLLRKFANFKNVKNFKKCLKLLLNFNENYQYFRNFDKFL